MSVTSCSGLTQPLKALEQGGELTSAQPLPTALSPSLSQEEQPQMPRGSFYFFLALFLFSSFCFFLESLGLLALQYR